MDADHPVGHELALQTRIVKGDDLTDMDAVRRDRVGDQQVALQPGQDTVEGD